MRKTFRRYVTTATAERPTQRTRNRGEKSPTKPSQCRRLICNVGLIYRNAFYPPNNSPWSGAYFGLNGGYGRGQSKNSYIVTSTTLANFAVTAAVNGAGSQSMSEPGAEFGAQAGYLWQPADWYAAGLEADADWAGMKGSVNTIAPLPVFGGNLTSGQRLTIDWTTSLRVRAGLVPAKGLLVYATGGAGLAGLRYNSVFNDRFNELETVSLSSAKFGWVAGAGVEYKFMSNLSARLEYLHAQYAATNGQGSVGLTDGTIATVAHSSGIVKVDSARLAINYFPGW